MSNVHVIDRGNDKESTDMMKAMEVGQILDKHYPGHPWIVMFQGGVLTVRHVDIDNVLRHDIGQQGFCFCIKHQDSYSASDLAKKAMQAGGQMLEAFNLPRGRNTGKVPETPRHWKFKETSFQ